MTRSWIVDFCGADDWEPSTYFSGTWSLPYLIQRLDWSAAWTKRNYRLRHQETQETISVHRLFALVRRGLP